jgi:hypothetical protein
MIVSLCISGVLVKDYWEHPSFAVSWWAISSGTMQDYTSIFWYDFNREKAYLQTIQALNKRNINKDSFVQPWPEAGLCVTDSPYDPNPSLHSENGVMKKWMGKRSDFDMIDLFISDHSLDLDHAAISMATHQSRSPDVGGYQHTS